MTNNPYDLRNLLKPFTPLISGFGVQQKPGIPATPTTPVASSPAPISPMTPAANTSTLSGPSYTPATNFSKPTTPNMSAISTPPSAPVAPTPTEGSSKYSVQAGDTLSAIASKNGMSLAQILDMNPQFRANPNLIRPGDVVDFGGASAPVSPTKPTNPSPTYQPNPEINPATGGVSTSTPAETSGTTPTAPVAPDLASILAEIDKYSSLSPEEEKIANDISNIESGLGITLAGEANRPIPMGFITGRQKAEEARALALEKPLTDRAAILQARRTGQLEGAKTKLGAVSPQSVSYGQTLVNPLTGKVIATGGSLADKNALDTFFNLQQTYPDATLSWDDKLTPQQNLAAAQKAVESSPSFQAKQTVYAINPLTGEPTIINKRIGSGGGGTNFGGPGTGGRGTEVTIDTLAPELKGALSNISGVQYFDAGKVTSGQLPYLQRAANEIGVPILSKEDANKVQEAFQNFSGANSLITQIKDLSGPVLTATNDPGSMAAQAARLQAIEIAPWISTDDKAKQFISARNSMLSLLTRAAGEKGVLTTQDVARIAQAMPGYTDNAQLAKEKAANFKQVMDSVLQGAIQGYIGQNTSASTGGGSATASPSGEYSGSTSSGIKYKVIP